jgi:hypothetical protein
MPTPTPRAIVSLTSWLPVVQLQENAIYRPLTAEEGCDEVRLGLGRAGNSRAMCPDAKERPGKGAEARRQLGANRLALGEARRT